MKPLKVTGRYYQMHPPEKFAGHQTQTFEVDFDRSALLAVDVYGHGFEKSSVVRDHPSFNEESNKPWDQVTLNYVRPAMEAARLAKMPVIYAHNSGPRIEINRSEIGKQLNRSLQVNLEDLFHERGVDPREYLYREETQRLFLETAPAVAPQPGDYFIRKHFYSGFKDTRLDTLLRNLDVKTLFCMGFDSSVCLLCTMIDAFELDYEVILLRDACLAIEIPEDTKIGYSFTERMIKWIEALLGRSIETKHFVELMRGIEPKAADVKVG